MKNAWKLGIGLVVVVVLGLAAFGMNQTKANLVTQVGFLDQELIVEAYAGPQLNAFVYEENRLQSQFDKESAQMNEEEKWELFTKYQLELDKIEKELGIFDLFDDINQAIEASAKAHGVSFVLDQHAIVYGGVDLTVDVLRRLDLLDE